MPLLFREGLVFMPGEKALFKSDDNSDPVPCTVLNFVSSGPDNLIKGYWITLDDSPDKGAVMCDLGQVIPLS